MNDIPAVQVKVTLPNDLYMLLRSKTEKFGLNVAAYIRNLVINDVKDIEIAVFKMSEKREKIANKALDDYKAGKTKVMNDLDKYFDRN